MIPVLGPDFTRADVADFINAWSFAGYMAVVLMVFMVSILVFRGK